MQQPQTCNTLLAPSKLGLGKFSHTISKIKPKIRIIHIVAPEIIKTDIENFREMVQRLTGKPTAEGKRISANKRIKSNTNVSSKALMIANDSSKPRKEMESQLKEERIMKKETTAVAAGKQIVVNGGQNSNGFLSLLEDVDCFINIQEMNEFHLPLVPFRSSSQMNLFGQMHSI